MERKGLRLVAAELRTVAPEVAKVHYAEHDGKPFFPGLVSFITSGPVVAFVVEGNGAIDGCRSTIGATDPIKSPPGSIRGDLAQTIGRNLVHGSDSAQSAQREIAIWFEPAETLSRKHALESWLVE